MKQTARIISTYSADVFGVCSALFELGGMVVMHDPSGCNSTYTTHDEPRWYDMDSMIYISGLSETEAIMGDDEKFISDIVSAANELHPEFIAVAGTPIPTMTGFDFSAAARLIEKRTGIPAFGFTTTGMKSYISGASMALEAIAKRFVSRDAFPGLKPAVNILGLTPLDFSLNGTDKSIKRVLEDAGFEVISSWAMGSSLNEMRNAGDASVNLVVSNTGLGAAKALKEMFGTPYVVGVPYGQSYTELLISALKTSAETGQNRIWKSDMFGEDIVIIGEGVQSVSLASAIELSICEGTKVLSPLECGAGILRKKDMLTPWEEDIEKNLGGAKIIIADPLFKPICPDSAKFISLPAESFSGRMFSTDIPDLVSGFNEFMEGVIKK